MYFLNENNDAVTKKDTELFFNVCYIINSLNLINERKIRKNPKWRLNYIDCHSLSRLCSISFKELTLVDGILYGIDLSSEDNQCSLACTYHSWLRTPDNAIIDPLPMGIISTTSAVLIPTSNTKYVVHGANNYQENIAIRENIDVIKSWKIARSYYKVLQKNINEISVEELVNTIM